MDDLEYVPVGPELLLSYVGDHAIYLTRTQDEWLSLSRDEARGVRERINDWLGMD